MAVSITYTQSGSDTIKYTTVSATGYTSPSAVQYIYFTATRNKDIVTIQAQVAQNMTSSGYFYGTGAAIAFNYGCSGVQMPSEATLKAGTDYWSGTTVHTSPVFSIQIKTTASSGSIYFYIHPYNTTSVRVVSTDNPTWAIPYPANSGNISVPIEFPVFRNVSAPTWISVSPNPCDVNSSPTISWGGASAGSMGTLRYRTAVQVKRSDGTWSGYDYYDRGTATSFRESPLNTQIISGVSPYVGIKYKYAVLAYDEYSSSGWIYSNELSVSFTSPSPPNSITLSPTTAKKDGTITVRWSGASGGSGSISRYYLQYRTYNSSTSSWGSYTTLWNGTATSYSATLSNIFPNARNNDRIMFRVYVVNSYNQTSSNYPTGTTPYILIKGNAIWVKVNGTWREGECYIKVNGTWREGTPYVKANGTWRETS